MYKYVFRTLAQFASFAVAMTTIAAAQGLQTGEIAGRVSSQDGLSLPGVTGRDVDGHRYGTLHYYDRVS